jgi:hypothetical protein
MSNHRGGIDDSSCSTQKSFTQRGDGGMVNTARLYPAGRSGAVCCKRNKFHFGRRFGQVRFGKSIYVKNEHGSDVAFEVINSDIEGWGRFTMLNLPEKADLTAEITSYDAGGFRVGGNPVYSAEGKPQDSMGARRDLSPASVTLKVYDAKTKRELWSGTEKVKSAFKKKAQEDNVVASAQKLFLRFHDFVQPPGT